MLKINHKHRCIDLSKPAIMGILNVTNDSFYDGGRYADLRKALDQAKKMVTEGAEIIDIGAVSTRPGGMEISLDEEWDRILKLLPSIRNMFSDIMISVDTFRSEIAKMAVDQGADMVNDISGGQLDDQMFPTISKLDVPYVMMHIKGTPQTMQVNPDYENITEEISVFFKKNLQKLASFGKTENIILDPGFGFGKTIGHNYKLLNELKEFKKFGCVLMTGVSRKSMIYKLLGNSPENAQNGTTVVNTIALLNGADILRVHDVAEAMEAVRIVGEYKKQSAESIAQSAEHLVKRNANRQYFII